MDMKVLKEKRAKVKKDLDKVGAASKEKWEAAKNKINAAIDDLKELYERIRSRVSSK